MSDLKDVLEDKETETPDTDEPEKPEAEADEAEAEGEGEGSDEEAPPEQAEAKDEEKHKAKRESKSVPLAAFLDVQRKLEAKLAEADKRAADAEAKIKTQPDYSSFYKKAPENIPSVLDDENAYTQSMRQAQSAEISNVKFQISLDNALSTFGQERVSEAISAFQRVAANSPALMQAAETSMNPVREIVQWHESQTKLSHAEKLKVEELQEIAASGGLDALKKSLRAQIEKELASKQVAEDDEEEEDAPPKKQNLPSNFNKGGKGGNKDVPADASLKALLA